MSHRKVPRAGPADPPAGARARLGALRLSGSAPNPRPLQGEDGPDAGPWADGWVPDMRARRARAWRRRSRRTGLRAHPLPSTDADEQPESLWHEAVSWPLAVPGNGAPPGRAAPVPQPARPGPIILPPQQDPPDVDTDPQNRTGWATRLVRRGPWGALAERWVPEPLRDARVNPGRRGAALLVVVAALAAVVAAVGVWRAKPEPRPVAPLALSPVVTGAPTGPASSSANNSANNPANNEATGGSAGRVAGAGSAESRPTGPDLPGRTAATGPILVSVTGRVRHPGLVAVPAGARVADAIAAAGGVLDPSDLTGLNLAAHLSDADSVVVAGPGGSSVGAGPGGTAASGISARAGPSGTAAPALVDLNTANQPTLEELPGVGPVTAAAIIAWRTEHGPFTSIDQLQAVRGIGPATYARIAPHVAVAAP